VASVESDGPPPTLTDLRRALWAVVPGAPWPAEAVVGDGVPLCAGADPGAVTLTAMWAEIGGRPVGPTDSYWQDFSFLRVLAEARQAGFDLGDQKIVRCRTPEMLAATLPASP
jgi:hypothetical protein